MSKFGKLSRIACAIVDIILGIALAIHAINKGKPEVIPLLGVLIIATVIWLFDFMKPKKTEADVLTGANKFFDEFIKKQLLVDKQLLEDKQLDEAISNYYN